MPKKSSNENKIVTVAVAVVLILSFFAGALTIAVGQQSNFPTQPEGSASEIAALESTIAANGGWNSSLQTIYDGIALGETTVGELQNAVDSVSVTSTSAAETVFYWYFELSKFGVGINATTIEAALNEVTMLPGVGGLPNDYSNNGVPSFILYNRFDLYAYQWAAELGFETSKWNLTTAYAVFNDAVGSYGEPILWVNSDGNGTGIGYGPRYYDECAETFDMYLTFWLLGIPSALSQAQSWWNYTNNNLWDASGYAGGGFYRYAVGWTVFECEAGGMDQLAWKLYYYDPSIQNVTNLFTDMETRFLSQGWNSPGWRNFTAVHASGLNGNFVNPQERLENTIMYWASLLGFYGNMTSAMQSQVQGLMDGSTGPAPAWSLLFQSELYDNSTGMFTQLSFNTGNVEDTADAAVLIMLQSTVPVTGSLAVPMEDSVYEDINSIIDGGVSSINYASQTVTVSIAQPGTFLSMLGTDIFEYDLNSSGIWQLTFSPDWNSIIAKTLLSPLPASRIYLGTTAVNSSTVYASSDNHSTINPSGLVNINYGGSQTFTYSADSGYTISQVLVDGSPVAITGSYTLTNVQASNTITISTSVSSSVSPTPSPSPTPTPSSTVSPTPSPTPTPTQAPSSSPPTLSPTSTPTPSPLTPGSHFSISDPFAFRSLNLSNISFGIFIVAPALH